MIANLEPLQLRRLPVSLSGRVTVGLVLASILSWAAFFFEVLPGMDEPRAWLEISQWELGAIATGSGLGLAALFVDSFACFVRHDTSIATIAVMLCGSPLKSLSIQLVFASR
jgi:hypothetical protein